MLFELDLEALFRCWCRKSDSFTDLVGDLDGERVDGERDETLRSLLFFFDSASEFFLGLKIPGRTIGCGLGSTALTSTESENFSVSGLSLLTASDIDVRTL